jgi:hypothetical protein
VLQAIVGAFVRAHAIVEFCPPLGMMSSGKPEPTYS